MIQGVIYSKRYAFAAGISAVIAAGLWYSLADQKKSEILADARARQEVAQAQSVIASLAMYSQERLVEKQQTTERFINSMFTEESWKTFSSAKFKPTDCRVTLETEPAQAGVGEFVRKTATVRFNTTAVYDWYDKIMRTLRAVQGEAIGIETINIETTGSDQRRQFESVSVTLVYFQYNSIKNPL